MQHDQLSLHSAQAVGRNSPPLFFFKYICLELFHIVFEK